MGNHATKSTSKDKNKNNHNKVDKSKVQLNGLAKSLFLRHCLSTDCKRRVNDKSKFFKFPVKFSNFCWILSRFLGDFQRLFARDARVQDLCVDFTLQFKLCSKWNVSLS